MAPALSSRPRHHQQQRQHQPLLSSDAAFITLLAICIPGLVLWLLRGAWPLFTCVGQACAPTPAAQRSKKLNRSE
jgi:hypothetical protein